LGSGKEVGDVSLVEATSIVFLVVLAVIQVFRPTKTNPQIDPTSEIHSNLAIPVGVAEVLQRSCNDCHSNQTVWP
jgi:Haem-binding domain